MKPGTLLIIAARLIVGFVMIYAALDKIADPLTFSRAINNYHLIPWGMENIMAITLPWIEMFVGIGLITGIFLDGAVLVVQGLMAVFILAIGSAILRGYDIECGCGLKSGELVGLPKLLEDFVYLGLSVLIYFRSERGRFELK
ncbi:MAG: DoxX family membrane protein [FCB group bacterium]|nr:DoxX family membrane protein [FCB group bacterium]